MALAEDMLEQAKLLATIDRTRPRQASLRRSVSTTYYALFYLLTSAAAANWKNRHQRLTFARSLDHGRMHRASTKTASSKFPSAPGTVAADLRMVARAFAKLQELRHMADYDGNKKWSRTETLETVDLAAVAFKCWKAVSKEKIAQDYLLQLLVQR